ncbi:MAG: HepT-like ribonuclease domain-containing protein [Paludibacter sp.]
MLNKDYYILLSLLETIEKIILYSQGYKSAEELNENNRDLDAILMNFIVLGEVIDKLSEHFKDSNTQITWNKIYGLRNIIAHNYFGINIETIWQIINDYIPVLKQQLEKLVEINR